MYLPGAPNGQFGPFRNSVFATVTDDSGRYTGDVFRQALAALPLGSIYPTDLLQQTVEPEAFNALTEVILAQVLSPADIAAVLPEAPAPVDIMAVWRQFDRPSAQWDGSIPGKLHRNLAASLGVTGIGDYDTSQSGNGSSGHVGPQFSGYINWQRHPSKLNDLLEYLKTL